ncbi:uncharacterized protein LOC114327824 [Diabrotica virgifera virgifera]|uniref:Uncharacterized protein LOC114327824 n=1 Tax=Diabrotica virgifera virgifera TaxID=50390 RepID=A0A6P7FGM2_DIAVI|nr:uncharacterized protein LOC114327824 [Diabrotica virgifera virgifera]
MKNFVALIILSCLSVIVLSQTTNRLCPDNSTPGCKPCCPDPSCLFRKPICPFEKVCKNLLPNLCLFECRCNPGYLKNIVGHCVLPDKCLLK